MKTPSAEEIRSAEAEHGACRQRTGTTRAEFDRLQRELQHLDLVIDRHLGERPHLIELLPADPLLLAWKSRDEQLQARKKALVSLRDQAQAKLREEEKAEKEAEHVMWQKEEIFLNRQARAARDEFYQLERQWTAAKGEVATCERECVDLQGELSAVEAELRDAYLTDEEQAEFEAKKESLSLDLTRARAALGEAKAREGGFQVQGFNAAKKFEALDAAHRVAKAKAQGDALNGPVGAVSGVV